ncbi:leucine-rich repeat-containing protein 37B-like [Dasypus novemcinctus]|uniref:leucine-rich repeat-containing protein 37B-like n=1 Tax=Dasypus novemcinctus TaxID=9361 RepID=UPI0039C8E852
MPPQLKSRSHTAALNQAEDNQSFETVVPPLEDSQSSKSAKFIASPSNLKKDLAHHHQLAKIGNSDQLAKTLQDQSYESDLLDPSLDIFYPPDGLPLDFLENLDELSESPEEAELSPHEWEIQTQHLEPAEELEQSQTQQEAPAEHPEPPEKVEPSPAQQETPAQSSDTLEGAELPAGQLEAPAQPSEAPEEAELPPVQPYDPAQPSEAHEEAEPPPFQLEAPAQPPEPEREAARQPPGNLVTVKHPDLDEAHFSNFPNVTLKPVDLQLTVTPEATSAGTSTEQEVPAQRPELAYEGEPSPGQQEGPAQLPGPSEDVETSPAQPEAPAQQSEPSEQVEPSPVEQEASAQPLEPAEQVESAPGQQEASAQSL